MIKIGSLFDGIGGFPLAGQRNGMTAIWASEIEPFPIKVSKIRFPDMKHHGDITKINCSQLEPVDIITGGSPCQDLSVAGKRAGLAGARSGLFMEQIRIVRELRDAEKRNGSTNESIRPRFMVWENVPGAFSSNKGEDFRAVLEETARIADETVIIPGPAKGKWNTVGCIMGNGYSIAWRILDAQYWGVPQRRRRIFLVADFGGQSAPEVLFKREGLSRHLAEGGEAREGIATDAERSTPKTMLIRAGCSGGGKGPLIQDNKSATLSCANIQTLFDPNMGIIERIKAMEFKDVSGPIAIDSNCQDSRFKLTGDISPTIPAKMGTGGNNGPMLAVQVYGICSDASNSMKSSNPHSGIYEAETSRTLDQNGGSPACNQGGMAIVTVFTQNQREEVRDLQDKAGALAAEPGVHQQTYVCIEPGALSRGQGERVWDKCPTLRAEMGDNHPCVISCASKQYSQNIGFNVAAPLMAEDYKEPQVICAGFCPEQSAKTRGIGYEEEIAPTLRKDVTPAVINCQPSGISGTVSSKWAKGTGGPAGDEHYNLVCAVDCRNMYENPEKSATLQSKSNGGQSLNYQNPVRVGYSVRRLTPLECERLQDYPDGWTDIPGASDSGRYKALGNSVAVCCPEYVLEGIKEVYINSGAN
jgi:DNA (cytosine-5)-methyltransferase 1